MARRSIPLTEPDPVPVDPMTGTIRHLDQNKGYGFIQTQEGRDYFFHRSSAEDFQVLAQGMAVVFLPSQGPKGLRAESVQAVGSVF